MKNEEWRSRDSGGGRLRKGRSQKADCRLRNPSIAHCRKDESGMQELKKGASIMPDSGFPDFLIDPLEYIARNAGAAGGHHWGLRVADCGLRKPKRGGGQPKTRI